MEGGRKRRKLQKNEKEEEDEDEDEEKKMELFYALIQNTKAMRDRMKSKELTEEEKSKGVWNPKFQPEDFIEEYGYYNNKSNIIPLQLPAASSSSTIKQSNEKKEQEEDGDGDKVGKGKNGIDLNLSL